MMKSTQNFLLVAFALLLPATFAAADTITGTITFDGVVPPAFYGYTTFTENGLNLYTEAMWIEGPAGDNCASGCLNNGTNVGVIHLASLYYLQNQLFTLNSFEYAYTSPTPEGYYTTLHVDGHGDAGALIYSIILELVPGNGFQTASLSWTDVAYVDFWGEGGIGQNWSYFSLDNINATAEVPEPGMLTLLGTGLLGIGGAIRSKLRR